jgi:hypothetical protein
MNRPGTNIKTLAEAASDLHVAESTVRRWVADGCLVVKAGRPGRGNPTTVDVNTNNTRGYERMKNGRELRPFGLSGAEMQIVDLNGCSR